MALVGGDVVLQGGNLTTLGGRIELGSVGSSSLVSLNPTNKGWTLSYEGVEHFKNIQLSSAATINASGLGGGNIQLRGGQVTLTEQSAIVATTFGNQDGGEVSIRAEQLTVEQDSILGTGTRGKGNSGNVILETNNLTIRAFTGKGGGVTINTQSIFGMVPRSREDLIRLLETNDPTQLDPSLLPTNDITAISQTNPTLSGVVTLNTPDVDPSRGLAELPVEPVNVEVTQGCQTGGKQASIEFFNTGKGGLAPNPYEPISSSELWEDVPSPTHRTASSASADSASASPANPPDKIVEAQGWLVNEKGQVVLVAEMPTTHSPGRCRLH